MLDKGAAMKKTAEAVSLGHPDKMADYISSYNNVETLYARVQSEVY